MWLRPGRHRTDAAPGTAAARALISGFVRPGRDVEGNWPAGAAGVVRAPQDGGVDLLLPVTLFVVADEMLSKKIKKRNFVEQTKGRVPVDVAGTWAVPGGA